MEFVQYSRDNLVAGLAAARAGNAITVPQYNSIVAYLAATEDYLNEPAPSTMAGRTAPILPTVRYRGQGGVTQVPLAGAVSEPPELANMTIQVPMPTNDMSAALKMWRAVFSESAALMLRRLRDYHQLVGTTPAGQAAANVYGETGGTVAIVGDAERAAVPAGLAAGRMVQIPRELADQIELLRPAMDAVVHSVLVAGQYNDSARGMRESGNPAAIEAALPTAARLSATFRSESRTALYVAGGAAIAALGLAYAFSQVVKKKPARPFGRAA